VFTGIVQAVGTVSEARQSTDGVTLRVRTPLATELEPGDSVAVNGVCLTATGTDADAFAVDVMNETLSRSSLGFADEGAKVNLELPLRATDRLGGHLVQGHVDAVGRVREVADDGFARTLSIEAPSEVLRYLVDKGSIAVDGVSLTVAALEEGSVTVSLIPETLERTTLGLAQAGTSVNLEVDVLAKYVERLVASR